MQYEISLEGFRGFNNQTMVPVRPITVLVGENSAGKTSFLSAVKYLLDFSSRQKEASFNKEPFQLGTFQQIAHFRGGRGGRVHQFSIQFVVPADRGHYRRRIRSSKSKVRISHQLTFSNLESQAAMTELRISDGTNTLVVTLANDGPKFDVIGVDGKSVTLPRPDGAVRMPRMDFSRYWTFFLQDMILRNERGRGDTDFIDERTNAAIETAKILAEYSEGMSSEMAGLAEATSAIRTKPQRTYTPGIENQDSEGTHVPFELAKLYRSRSKDEWVTIKSAIDEFGKASSMFKEIDLKSFGKTSSDPFQLQFSLDGPKMNLVDLGYGTSQVLPIVYSINSARSNQRLLIQQPEVHLHPRAQAALGQLFVDSYISRGTNFVLETHSDFIVDRIRNAVSIGTIDSGDVSILFFERRRLENFITHVELGDNGEPISVPDSYREFFLGEQLQLLGIK